MRKYMHRRMNLNRACRSRWFSLCHARCLQALALTSLLVLFLPSLPLVAFNSGVHANIIENALSGIVRGSTRFSRSAIRATVDQDGLRRSSRPSAQWHMTRFYMTDLVFNVPAGRAGLRAKWRWSGGSGKAQSTWSAASGRIPYAQRCASKPAASFSGVRQATIRSRSWNEQWNGARASNKRAGRHDRNSRANDASRRIGGSRAMLILPNCVESIDSVR